jgi:serine protease
VLGIGQTISSLSGVAGSQAFWQITVPAGTASLTVTITGSTSSTSDADLYTRAGSHPTTTAYDCRPYKVGSNETCTYSAPAAGTYYVMLRGYTAYSGVTLSAK